MRHLLLVVVYFVSRCIQHQQGLEGGLSIIDTSVSIHVYTFGSEITPTHFADTKGPLLMGVANLDPVRLRTRSFRYRLYDRVIQPSLPSEQISPIIFEIPYRD